MILKNTVQNLKDRNLIEIIFDICQFVKLFSCKCWTFNLLITIHSTSYVHSLLNSK